MFETIWGREFYRGMTSKSFTTEFQSRKQATISMLMWGVTSKQRAEIFNQIASNPLMKSTASVTTLSATTIDSFKVTIARIKKLTKRR
jgi:hypothetical protein